jgi:sugar/nucleoside kinase (ribokinase family)
MVSSIVLPRNDRCASGINCDSISSNALSASRIANVSTGPTFRIDPADLIDTIGAGDSFNAGFLSSYLKGEDPLRAAALGNVTGALSTLRPGGTEAYRDGALRDAFLKQHPIT